MYDKLLELIIKTKEEAVFEDEKEVLREMELMCAKLMAKEDEI